MDTLLTSKLVIEGSAFIGAAITCWLATRRFVLGNQRVDRRFRDWIDGNGRAERRAPHRKDGMFALLEPLSDQIVSYLIPNDASSRTLLQSQLYRAGIYSPSAIGVYAAAKIGLAIAPLAIGVAAAYGLLPWPQAIAGGAIAGLFGMAVPPIALRWLVARRAKQLRKSLPDFLDLLVTCVEGGMSVQAAFGEVAKELSVAHPILSSEFLVVQREVEIGRNVDVALQNLADRTGLDELRSLTTYVQHALKIGSTMSDALRQLSDMLRTQREQRAEEQAHRAAVLILLPTLMFIFPTVFVVLVGPAVIQIQRALLK